MTYAYVVTSFPWDEGRVRRLLMMFSTDNQAYCSLSGETVPSVLLCHPEAEC